MDEKDEKLVELGVLVCYVADALKGDARLKTAAYHLDRAAGVIADLLPEPPRTQPVEAPAPTAESAPVERAEVLSRKKCGRKRIPICPRCKSREKAPGNTYCRECARVYNTNYRRRREAGKLWGTPADTPAEPDKPEAPVRRRGGSKNAKLYAPDAPETAAPEIPNEPTTGDQYDRLLAECRRRGYDPDLMLGLAQALPKIGFRKTGGGYMVPTRKTR